MKNSKFNQKSSKTQTDTVVFYWLVIYRILPNVLITLSECRLARKRVLSILCFLFKPNNLEKFRHFYGLYPQTEFMRFDSRSVRIT